MAADLAPDPRRLAAQRRAEIANSIRYIINVGEDEYVVRLGELSAVDVRELRNQAGLTVLQLVQLLEAWDLEGIAAAVWIAKRQTGDRQATWEQVADALNLGDVTMVEVENSAEPHEDHPDPQPSGGSSGE